MDFERPLDSVLATRASLAVLRALVDLPVGLSVSARDLARRAGVSHPTVLSVVERLHAQGLIKARREPKRDSYTLNRDHVLAEKLAELIEWESSLSTEMVKFIKAAIKQFIPKARLALLFGSAVTNGLNSTSDIDLFLLVPDIPDLESQVMRLQDVVQERFGNRLSVIWEEMTKDEFLGRASRNPLWRRILQEGRPLVGDV